MCVKRSVIYGDCICQPFTDFRVRDLSPPSFPEDRLSVCLCLQLPGQLPVTKSVTHFLPSFSSSLHSSDKHEQTGPQQLTSLESEQHPLCGAEGENDNLEEETSKDYGAKHLFAKLILRGRSIEWKKQRRNRAIKKWQSAKKEDFLGSSFFRRPTLKPRPQEHKKTNKQSTALDTSARRTHFLIRFQSVAGRHSWSIDRR